MRQAGQGGLEQPIYLTVDGPRIVEANAHWGMDPGPHQGALYERMRTA